MNTSDPIAWLNRIPALLWAPLLLAGWLGFIFGTPAKRLDALEHDYSALQQDIADLNQRIDLNEKVNTALAKKACYESPPELRAYLDLPCGQLLAGQGLSLLMPPTSQPGGHP